MNIKALRIFVKIMDLGTLTNAAKALFVSEPAASRLLGILEKQLDLKLFSRERRRLTATPEALAFYREALHIIASIESLPSVIQDIKADCQPNIRIVCMPRFFGSLVLPTMKNFLKAMPNTRIQITLQPRAGMERRVANEQYDFGIGTLPLLQETVTTEPMCKVPICAILRRDSSLAKKKKIFCNELESMPYIALSRDTIIRQHADRFLAKSDISITPTIEISTVSGAIDLVRNEFGFAIADSLSANWVIEKDLCPIPIKPQQYLEVVSFSPFGSELTKSAKVFLNTLLSVCKEITKTPNQE